jgi:hypothetical protein
MFKLVENPTFTHTVRVQTPIDGGHKEELLKATYRVLRHSEVNDLDLKSGGGSRDFLTKAIVKLDDLQDEQGRPLPYSDELRAQLLDLPHVRVALAQGYFAAVGKAPEGN